MGRLALAPLASQVGQLVLVVVHGRGASVAHELIVLHGPQALVEQHEGELELVGDIASRGVAAGQEVLDGQRLDLAIGEVGLGERVGLDGHKGVLGVVGEAVGQGGPRLRVVGRQLVDATHQGVEGRVGAALPARRDRVALPPGQPGGRGRRRCPPASLASRFSSVGVVMVTRSQLLRESAQKTARTTTKCRQSKPSFRAPGVKRVSGRSGPVVAAGTIIRVAES